MTTAHQLDFEVLSSPTRLEDFVDQLFHGE